MHIRAFRSADAARLGPLFYNAVHTIACRDYCAAQLHAWAPVPPAPQRFIDWADDGRLLLIAADEVDDPLAFGDLEPDGHIDHLYCRADRAGSGVAIALYDAIEAAARQRQIAFLYTEASEPARRFFERRGFVTGHRRDFHIGDIAMHNYHMEKRL